MPLLRQKADELSPLSACFSTWLRQYEVRSSLVIHCPPVFNWETIYPIRESNERWVAQTVTLSGIKEVFGGSDGLAVEVNSYASHISTDSPLNYAKEAEDMSIEFADYLYSASAGMMTQILTGSLLNTYI